jgi:hypothetical protein
VDRPPIAALPRPADLPGETQACAAEVSALVTQQYLTFRRNYYHEEQPSLDTPPPPQAEIRQAEIARVAETTLLMLPPVLKTLPGMGGLLAHLQQVADIHSLSEQERTVLHNMTLCFLFGTQGGVQPWYVGWLLASAHNLSRAMDPTYFMDYPWEALLYLGPEALARCDAAVATQDIPAIEETIRSLADRLIRALHDPVQTQVELAFTGPSAEERQRAFNRKTTAALTIGALLVAEEARLLLRPQSPTPALSSALPPLPPELRAHLLPSGGAQLM